MKNKNIVDAFKNSQNGLRELFKEKASKREAWLVVLSLITVYLYPNFYSILLLVISILLLSTEAINTSIEKLCDHITPEINEEIKKVKDLASAGILLLVVLYLIVFILAIGKLFQLEAWLLVKKNATQNIIASNSAEYLVFIGTTLLSLVLIRNKKWIWAKIIFILGLAWVLIHKPLSDFLNKIGLDSFSEAKNFDINEAKFWLYTLIPELKIEPNLKHIALYLIMALLTALVIRWLLNKSSYSKQRYSFFKFAIASILIGYGVNLTISDSKKLFFQNSEEYIKVKNNFNNKPPNITYDGKPLTITVYIGESTSIMNMGIYGYPRNTTPELEKFKENDIGFLVFNNVFSTHTHTSPSLLEGLSFGINEADKNLPINERKRISLVDVIINNTNTDVNLYSNQGSSGTWNQASSIIFKNAKRFFSTENRLLGNNDPLLEKPYDDVFFETIKFENRKLKNINFLHSYAGHGPYIKNIPSTYADVIDSTFKQIDKRAIVGNDINLLDGVEEYDSTIRYIDHSVAKVLQKIKSSTKPNIFIYFSDHGDAVYAGRGHDSSRFIHEMARIPFIIYFNEAARKLYPEKYDQYLALSKTNETSTLSQLPSSIINLLGLQIDELSSTKLIQKPIIGIKTDHDPIVVRKTTEGTTFVDLNGKTDLAKEKNLIDKTDDATKIYTSRKNFINKDVDICYHRSNSLGKAIRGGLATNCIEIDLFVEGKTKELFVFHPPAPNVNLEFKKIYDHALKNRLSIWIDGNNLTEKKNCDVLSSFLKKQKKYNAKILVDFPSGSYKNKIELNDCANGLSSNGYAVSYYVPTGEAVQCSQGLKAGQAFESISSCKQLKNDLKLAIESNIFTDISFDYGGIDAIRKIEFVKKLKWNTWHVSADHLNDLVKNDFRMIIMSNTDPNNL